MHAPASSCPFRFDYAGISFTKEGLRGPEFFKNAFHLNCFLETAHQRFLGFTVIKGNL